MLSLSASYPRWHKGAFLEGNLLDLFLFNLKVSLPSPFEYTFSRTELKKYLPQIAEGQYE